MKILTFGTCRITQLFDKSINNTFLESLHYLNYGNYGGHNVISFSHDLYQTSFLLNLIKNNRNIKNTDEDYYLLQKLSVFIQNTGDYRENLLSVIPEYDINDSIQNIHNELNEIKYIIIEVCTLKKLIINGVPLYLDINDQNQFSKISDEEFNEDFDNLVNLVKSINPNIKIIFVSHFISFRNEIIPERLHILNLLKENIKKYNNCYVICPTDHITDDDLEDNRHYKPESRYKIVNLLCDKILDIESTEIVNKMNHSGIMEFNVHQFLNNKELESYNNLNNVLDTMIEKIKLNEHNSNYVDDNKYMYSINNYLGESYNLNNNIFIDFFRVVLNNIVTKVAEKYLENDVYIYNALMAVNYNSLNDRVQSQNWHRDPGGRKLIKFFFFFDEVGELNGSFEYIPNTQYTSLSRITDIFDFGSFDSIYAQSYTHLHEYNDFVKLSNENRLVTTSCKYGCISVDTTGFHRAGFCSKNYFRKYLHVLFLTKQYIINNRDPCDVYQNGFNHSKVYNIDYDKIDEILGNNTSTYFY
jgi:hypothetical protein